MKVCKFGGTSMACAKSIVLVKNIVESDESRRFVVVSAPGKRFSTDSKVTDLLIKMKSRFDDGKDYAATFRLLEDRFCEIERELGASIDAEKELEAILNGMKSESLDFIASRGEYLSAKIFAKLLGTAFVDAKDVVKFLGDDLDFDETIKRLKASLSSLDRAVIPGFYGSDKNGKIKTFSRGGSDITGSLVARALMADVYENWTDVGGVYDADPRKFKSAKLLERLSYDEMFNMSSSGANVLHKDAVYPVREAGIPIHINDTFNPQGAGTWIEDR